MGNSWYGPETGKSKPSSSDEVVSMLSLCGLLLVGGGWRSLTVVVGVWVRVGLGVLAVVVVALVDGVRDLGGGVVGRAAGGRGLALLDWDGEGRGRERKAGEDVETHCHLEVSQRLKATDGMNEWMDGASEGQT